MNKQLLDRLYGDVVEQITDNLKRDGSTEEAIANHETYCASIIAAITSMDEMDHFVKDIVLAFAGKIEFLKEELLANLLREAKGEYLVVLRQEKAYGIIGAKTVVAWKHVASKNPEIAVVIIALCYRLSKEGKMKKLFRAEKALEKHLKQNKKQETEFV